jgi:hypothetical protein
MSNTIQMPDQSISIRNVVVKTDVTQVVKILKSISSEPSK